MFEFEASEGVHALLRADSAVTRMMTMYSQYVLLLVFILLATFWEISCLAAHVDVEKAV